MSDTNKIDILVLGATGFTGRLITRYLYAHPACAYSPNYDSSSEFTFTFGLGARSMSKLKTTVVEPLSLAKEVPLIEVDVMNVDDLERAFGLGNGKGEKRVKVVISTVGPFWKYGTELVRTCAKHGIHYVDTTGETPWLKDIIEQFDYLATKSGAIIVPSCGLDSIPADLSVYLASRALHSHHHSSLSHSSASHPSTKAPHLGLGPSITALALRGGLSGGTLQTIISLLSELPPAKMRASAIPYALSPVKGPSNPGQKIVYRLPSIPGVMGEVGMLSMFGAGDRAVVHRSWGLLELRRRNLLGKGQGGKKREGEGEEEMKTYGEEMTFEEFMVTPNVFLAGLFGGLFVLGAGLLIALKPLRWLVQRFGLQPGSGPSESTMQNGRLVATNVTSTDSQTEPKLTARTVITGKGDPGYLLTSVMTAESALALFSLLPDTPYKVPEHGSLASSTSITSSWASLSSSTGAGAGASAFHHTKPTLNPIARQGGILTPSVAFGDVLVDRLERSGRFVFESEVFVGGEGRKGR